jgi:hypothetical protein
MEEKRVPAIAGLMSRAGGLCPRAARRMKVMSFQEDEDAGECERPMQYRRAGLTANASP